MVDTLLTLLLFEECSFGNFALEKLVGPKKFLLPRKG